MEHYDVMRPAKVQIIRRTSMETYMVRIYTGSLSQNYEFVSVEAEKTSPAVDILTVAVKKLKLDSVSSYELAEVFSSSGQLCKERRLDPMDNPVRIQLMWPKIINTEMDKGQGLLTGYRFYLRKKDLEGNKTNTWTEYKDDPSPVDNFLTAFLKQPLSNKEYTDLCNLPDLNERTLMENIKSRFLTNNIYTYVGSILIAVNPFKFFPIYNPIYVKMYQNKRLGEMPPHIFAIADAAYHTMLRNKKNQCIVISGESGSGKTESTNLLLHHLTALSQKGSHGSGVEQTILGAGPVLEAFGNAKTVHNNNSSRFGKFIQVNYKENGMVHGAIVEKYLLEKSRIVYQAKNERNYHVFYYLLEGSDDSERAELFLSRAEDYYYLRQSDCYTVDGIDEEHEFARLRQSLETVGFSATTQKRGLWPDRHQTLSTSGMTPELSQGVLLGKVKKGEQHHDESVNIKNESTVKIISKLLKVQEKTLVEALTQKKTVAGDETVFINYKMEDALATRNAMAKCLYGALFDWIVLKVNQALLAKRHNSEHQGNSIGVLDIFGFEDFARNSFEQFCINYANEHLQYYFNQHIFKFEQEEYKREGIQWRNIEFIDNTGCLELFSKRPHGLFCLLDEECNFPGATNETLLTKFNHHHKKNTYYEVPPVREEAFVVVHYAGKVRYGVMDFREKNADHIRQDIVGVLKNSSLSFVRELMGLDPVAVLRWAIIRAFFRSVVAFQAAGRKYRASGASENKPRKISAAETVKNEDNLLRLYRVPLDTAREPLSNLHDNQINACVTTVDSDSESEDSPYKSPSSLTSPTEEMKNHMELILSEEQAKVMRKATRVLLKNKSFRPKHKPPVNFRDIKTLKAIANRTVFGGSTRGFSKNRPPSVGAQFQWSLSRLMETLNQANPFFIRCIKSNAEKAACRFDEQIVLRQLRYTGMLATVKIRQSGYNYRLTFEEFIQMYKILLPKGLLSSKDDVRIFLEKLDINHENYQIGINKVFLRETEKILLDESLHRAIMERVVRVQRWMKTIIEQRKFQTLRASSLIIQKNVRRFLAQRYLRCHLDAVLVLQKHIKGFLARKAYWLILDATIIIQSYCRRYLASKQYKKMLEERDLQRKLAEEKLRHRQEDLHSSTSDEGILMTKGSSAEELEIDREYVSTRRQDSEESSGILEDSESETLSVDHKSHSESIPTTPTSPDHNSLFSIQSLSDQRDEFLAQPRSSARVLDIAKVFQQKVDDHNQDLVDGNSKPPLHGYETPTRSLYLRRGSKKSKHVAAPLATQESFSDLELSPSPEKLGVSFLLSPDKRQAIEDIVRKHKERQEQEGNELLGSDLDKTDTSLSPFRRARNHVKNILGGTKAKKKDLPTDESDDDDDAPAKRPTNLGVSVFPPSPPKPVISSPTSSPKSKKENWVGDPVPTTPIQGSNKVKKKRRRSVPKGPHGDKILQSRSNFNLARTAQWQYPADLVIVDVSELQALDDFIFKKMQDLSKDVSGRRDTIFDVVFKRALMKFRQDLMASISVEIQKNCLDIKYRDLLANFEEVLAIQVKLEGTNASFPVTMGINAFRGFLDEFMKTYKKKREEKKVENKHIKKDKEKKKDTFEHMGHKYSQVQFNIPTFCEFCTSIIWIMEKGQVCQVCKYTCHKKCCIKSNVQCKGFEDSRDIQTSHIFGATLSSLVNEGQPIPIVCDKLISAIELHGLYTQGIYRKSGAVSMVKQLKQQIDSDISSVDFDCFHIHVLTATLKTFFRELPEPVLSFEQYDHFLRAAEVQDEKEKMQALYAVIDRLPKINHDLFERLIFHLARVAFHESSNKMSVNGLAIIFAPCLLRTNKKLQAQETLNHVPRQTKCIESILSEQLKKLRSTFADISTLESAERTASHRLDVVRASMRTSKIPEPAEKIIPPLVKEESFDSSEGDLAEEEEKALTAHIESIQHEKDSLKFKLPAFENRHLSSDDDLLSCDDDESQYDTAEEPDDGNEEYAVTFDLPVSPPAKLQHLTKKRVSSTPSRRPPKQFIRAISRHSVKGLDQSDNSLSSADSFISESLSFESMAMPVLRNIVEDDDEIMV